MKYHDPNNPSVIIESPTPGHFVIVGHNPTPFLDPEQGYIVPPRETYVAPECPSSALLAILEERGDLPNFVKEEADEEEERKQDEENAKPSRKAGRPRKETVVVLPSSAPASVGKMSDVPRKRAGAVGFNSPEFEGAKMSTATEGGE